MTSSFTRAATAIGLASAGFGYMSLAWASLAGVATTAALAAWYRPTEMGWRPAFAQWRPVVSFGGLATGTTLVNILGTHAPDFVLGRVLGFEAVGLYSRGQSLVRLFSEALLNAVRPVVLPALSARHRAGDDLEGAYLKAVGYLTGLAWPFFGFVGLMAYPIIRIAFGPQWDAAVPVAQVLCFAAAIVAPWAFANHLLMSIGRIGKVLTAEALATPVQVIVLVILAFHSLEAAALAAVCRSAMLALAHTYFVKSHLGIGLFDILRATAKSLGLAACTCAIPAAVLATTEIGPDNLLIPFAVALLGAGASWLLGLFLLDHPLREELVLGARGLRPLILRSGKRARGSH